VEVVLQRSPAELAIEVCDDGVGLSAGSPRSLGLEIVETLVLEDLNGAWSLAGDGGTVARITIPIA
jgi:two-component sensor histidine kinase